MGEKILQWLNGLTASCVVHRLPHAFVHVEVLGIAGENVFEDLCIRIKASAMNWGEIAHSESLFGTVHFLDVFNALDSLSHQCWRVKL